MKRHPDFIHGQPKQEQPKTDIELACDEIRRVDEAQRLAVREEVEIERNEAGGSCCVCVQRPDLR
jgi:hypothetical protein